MSSGTASSLGHAHRRFARAALLIYLGSSVLAIAMLSVSLVMDRQHEVAQRRVHLLVETQARAGFLARHLGLLGRELSRLSLRPELDRLAEDPEPASQLLRVIHEKGSFFGSGIAVLGASDRVSFSAPRRFLPAGTSVAREPWLKAMKRTRTARIVPVTPSRDDALVYLVSPVVRAGRYLGALVGAIDLDRDEIIHRESQAAVTVLSTMRGDAVYPSRPPRFTKEAGWLALFKQTPPFIIDTPIAGRATFVACVHVPGTHLRLLSLVPREQFLEPARARLVTRLAIGLSLVIASLGGLVFLLVRSLRVFRRSQEAALREQNLRQLGEATNLIAHEVKNSLNALRLGVDIILRRAQATDQIKQGQTSVALTQELQRLTEFTSELLIFSKGISPRLVPMELGELARRVGELMQPSARELAVDLDIRVPDGRWGVKGDPTLLHMVISNLITNGLEAAAGARADRPNEPPRVAVGLERLGPELALRVDDNGGGVPARIRPRLFEPFVTSKPSGVGIGLALSFQIARAHGGDLLLDRAASCTSFLLKLPAEVQ